MSARSPQAVAARIDALVDDFASSPDAAVRAKARELVTLLMELYGAGLGRVVEIARREGGDAGPVLAAMARDELVASLLVLHDLHPEECGVRVARALERVRELAGAEVTLAGIDGDRARVRVGAGRRARVRPAELRRLVDEVVRAAAPEVARVEIDGLADGSPPALVQLTREPPAARTLR